MSLFEEFEKMRKEMDRMFNELSKMKLEIPKTETRADISETADSIIVSIDIPGVKKEDIDLNVTEDSIEARAQRRGIKEEKKVGYHSMEKSYAGYHVFHTFPARVKPETSQAAYLDGVLTVKIEKAEAGKKKEAKKIKIK